MKPRRKLHSRARWARQALLGVALASGCVGGVEHPRRDASHECQGGPAARVRVAQLLGEGKLDRTARALQGYMRGCVDPAPDLLVALAEVLLDLGRPQEAEVLATQAARHPLAASLAEREQRVRSRAARERSAVVDPRATYARGVEAKMAGDLSQAQRWFDRAMWELEASVQKTQPGARRELDVADGLTADCACSAIQLGFPCSCNAPAATRPEIWRFGEYSALAISPDGSALAAARGERVHLVDPATLKERRRLEGHAGFVRAIAFQGDGRFVVTASEDGTARRWDAATGKELTRITATMGAWFTTLATRADGSVALGTNKGSVTLWDPASSTQFKEPSEEDCSVVQLSVSDDDKTVTGTSCQGVALWDVGRAPGLLPVKRRLDGRGEFAQWLPGGELVVIRDRELVKYDRQLVAQPPIRLAGAPATGLACRGGQCAVPGADVIVDIKHRTAKPMVLGQSVRSVAWSPDGKVLATSEASAGIRLRDVETGAVRGAIATKSPALRAFAVSPDGSLLASVWADGSLRVLDLRTGKIEWMVRVGAGGERADVAFSPDGATVAAFTGTPTQHRPASKVHPTGIASWDARTGAPMSRTGGCEGMRSLAWSPDGSQVAAACYQEIVRYSMPGWRPLSSISTRCTDNAMAGCDVLHLSYLRDGGGLVAYYEGAPGPRRWDLSGAALPPRSRETVYASRGSGGVVDFAELVRTARMTYGGQEPVRDVAFRPGHDVVAAALDDRTIRLYDPRDGRELTTIRGHTDVVSSVAWIESGRILVSGGYDGSLRFFSPEGKELAVIRVLDDSDESYVFTEGADTRIELFGDEVASLVNCRVGSETLPFDACAEAFSVKGLLGAALRGDPISDQEGS